MSDAAEERPYGGVDSVDMCIAQVADIFATGVVAGAFLMGSFAVHPAAAMLAASSHVTLRQELIRRLKHWMPPFMFLPVFASIAAMMLCRTSVFWTLEVLCLAMSLATVGITVAVNAPLNRRFAAWSAEALPHDWEKSVHRWNLAHWARTATAVAAFLCAIAASS